MAYDEKLAERIRERFSTLEHVEEKAMMGGLCFMYNNKMCVGIIHDELMCRIDPTLYEELLEKGDCKEMRFTGKPMKGYVLVEPSAMQNQKQFDYWIDLCLAFNPQAKASRKKNG